VLRQLGVAVPDEFSTVPVAGGDDIAGMVRAFRP
jgi:hypothetical protein